MLKNILELEGVHKINKKIQKEVIGGFDLPAGNADCRAFNQVTCPSFCRLEECNPNTPLIG